MQADREKITKLFCDNYMWHSYQSSVGLSDNKNIDGKAPDEEWRLFVQDLNKVRSEVRLWYENLEDNKGYDVAQMFEKVRANVEKGKVNYDVVHRPDPQR